MHFSCNILFWILTIFSNKKKYCFAFWVDLQIKKKHSPMKSNHLIMRWNQTLDNRCISVQRFIFSLYFMIFSWYAVRFFFFLQSFICNLFLDTAAFSVFVLIFCWWFRYYFFSPQNAYDVFASIQSPFFVSLEQSVCLSVCLCVCVSFFS